MSWHHRLTTHGTGLPVSWCWQVSGREVPAPHRPGADAPHHDGAAAAQVRQGQFAKAGSPGREWRCQARGAEIQKEVAGSAVGLWLDTSRCVVCSPPLFLSCAASTCPSSPRPYRRINPALQGQVKRDGQGVCKPSSSFALPPLLPSLSSVPSTWYISTSLDVRLDFCSVCLVVRVPWRTAGPHHDHCAAQKQHRLSSSNTAAITGMRGGRRDKSATLRHHWILSLSGMGRTVSTVPDLR